MSRELRLPSCELQQRLDVSTPVDKPALGGEVISRSDAVSATVNLDGDLEKAVERMMVKISETIGE